MSTWLLDVVVRVSMILGLALAARAALQRRSAALRHAVVAAAAAGSLCLPWLMSALPARVTVRAWMPAGSPPATAALPAAAADDAPVAVAARFRLPAPAGLPSRSPAHDSRSGIGWIWMAGVLVGAIPLLAGLLRTRRLIARSTRLDDPRWTASCRAVAARLGVTAPVRLCQSSGRPLIVAWGWRRPTLVLPADAVAWSDERMAIVLAHELAHVRRSDWLWLIASEILCILYWCTPLAWLARARLRIDSERACDDAVLGGGIAPEVYAAHLLALARQLRDGGSPRVPAPAMARSSGLEGRVAAMLNRSLCREAVSSRAAVVVLAGVAALTLAVASVRAQTPLHTFSGVVVDPSGRALAQSTLVLSDPAAHVRHEVRAGGDGRFRLVGLPAASYDLAVAHPGFRTLNERLPLAADSERELRLRVGSLQETITVAARPPAPAVPDPATVQRRAEAQQRSASIQRAELARCASEPAGTLGGRLLPPRKLVDVRPLYPTSAQAAGLGGIVTLDATIGVDGFVREVANVDGPDAALEAAAADAVRQWQFSPTLLNCEPIDVEMQVTIRFAAAP